MTSIYRKTLLVVLLAVWSAAPMHAKESDGYRLYKSDNDGWCRIVGLRSFSDYLFGVLPGLQRTTYTTLASARKAWSKFGCIE